MSEKISCTSAETCKPSLKKAIFGAVLAGGGLYGTVYGAIDANGPISGQTGTTLYEQNARVTVEEVSRVAGSEAYADGIIAGLGFGGIIAGCLLLAREENTRAKRAMEKRGTKSEQMLPRKKMSQAEEYWKIHGYFSLLSCFAPDAPSIT